jgi:hypothetical protein
MGIRVGPLPPFANTKSIYFDGSDQYLNIGAPSVLSNTSNFSISCWVKKGTSSTVYTRVFGKYASASDNLFLGTSLTTNYFTFWITNGGSTSQVVSNVGIGFNVWKHVTLVYDGTLTGNQNRAKIYVDGVNVTATDSGTIPATTSANTSDFYLSNVNGLGIWYYLGYMDEFAIFNYSLTQQNVTDIYNSGIPNDLNLLTTPPINWLRMGDNDTYPTIADVGSAASNPGTMTNMDAGDIVSDVPL